MNHGVAANIASSDTEADTGQFQRQDTIHSVAPETPPSAHPEPSKYDPRKRDYMGTYMRYRRAADRAGFGGSPDKAHPKYNPNHKTVSAYLEHLTGKNG